MTDTDIFADYKIHKAVDGPNLNHCAICGQRIKIVPGGQGTIRVHVDSQAVAAPNPPRVTSENVGRFKDRPLNDIMEFDHVIRVHRDGQITSGEIGAPMEPDVENGDLANRESGEWSLMTGYTGQDRVRHQPVMHNSEFIGGRMEEDIRSTPGLYVALIMRWDLDEDSDDEDRERGYIEEGWVVAYIHDDDPDNTPGPA